MLATFRDIQTPREFMRLRDAMDELLAGSFVPSLVQNERAMSVDLFETKDAFVLEAALPGVKAEDVDIEATEDTIRVSAKIEHVTEEKEPAYLRRERMFGTFQRSFGLPSPIDRDKVDATYLDGVLTLRLPKSEKVKPKQVAIKIPTKA